MLKYLLKYINLHIIQIILGFVQIIFSSLNIQILVFPEHLLSQKLHLSKLLFTFTFISVCVCLK